MTKRAVLLEALASTPADVGRLVRGLDESAATWRGDGWSWHDTWSWHDAWSCRDVVAHLSAIEPLYLARLRRIVAEDKPTVAALYPDESTHDTTLPTAALAERFLTIREVTIAWLREISAGDWQRPAIHETKGPTTLRFLVQDLVAHDIEHTSQLAAIIGLWRAERRHLAGWGSDQRNRQDAGAPGGQP